MNPTSRPHALGLAALGSLVCAAALQALAFDSLDTSTDKSPIRSSIAAPPAKIPQGLKAQRHAMIAEGAYYRSLERGPLDGDPVEDWLSAERMIDSAILPHR